VSHPKTQTSQTSVDLIVRGPADSIRPLISGPVGRAWKGHDPRRAARTDDPGEAWICESRLAEWVPLERHVDDVLEQVRPVWADLKRAGADGHAYLWVVLWVGPGSQPLWKLTAAQLADLAGLRADFEVDIYDRLPEDDD
jgi:hypothetical protein